MSKSFPRAAAGVLALALVSACAQDGPMAPLAPESARFSTAAGESLVFYGIVGDRVMRIDPVTYGMTEITTSPLDPIDGLAAGTEGWLLVTDTDPRSPPPYELHGIEISSGLFSTIGPSGPMSALVLHPALGLLGVFADRISMIDDAGNSTFVATLDLGGSGAGGVGITDLALTADGSLYGIVWDPGDMTRNIPAQGSRLVHIDLATLEVSDVAFLGADLFNGVTEWDGGLVVISCDGFDNTLHSVDPATGTVEQLGVFNAGNSCVRDLATALGTREEPPTPTDNAPPVIVFTGNAGTYGIDDMVVIDCEASDAGSGIATTTCVDINAPAYTFDVGVNTLEAEATDNAGNTAQATSQFTVVVTPASLAALTRQLVAHHGIANALAAKLDAGSVAAFVKQLRAQAGKQVPADVAALLERLAGGL